jgi:hypothetical protein
VLSDSIFTLFVSIRTLQLCVGLMRDKVSSVRLAAAEAFCLMSLVEQGEAQGVSGSTELGPWSESIVIPQLYSLMQGQFSRDRQLALFMIQVIVALGAVTTDVTIGVFVPLVVNASSDPVSNIRLAVAKTVDFFVRSDPEGVDGMVSSGSTLSAILRGHSELEKYVQRLGDDEDHDVSFYARRSFKYFHGLHNCDTVAS